MFLKRLKKRLANRSTSISFPSEFRKNHKYCSVSEPYFDFFSNVPILTSLSCIYFSSRLHSYNNLNRQVPTSLIKDQRSTMKNALTVPPPSLTHLNSMTIFFESKVQRLDFLPSLLLSDPAEVDVPGGSSQSVRGCSGRAPVGAVHTERLQL